MGANECGEAENPFNVAERPRGGVRVFPECNAPNSGSLHIIDFSLCAVISRLTFAEFATRGIAQVNYFTV